jgi:hypothetical protein
VALVQCSIVQLLDRNGTLSNGAIIRNYVPSDLEIIKEIHNASGIDYSLPNLNSPLFLVTKVLEIDGVVRAAVGSYVQVEIYLWLDKTNWADPEQKMAALKLLDKEVIEDVWLKGVDCAVLWLPPGMQRFGERLTKNLGFDKDRTGWVTYSKPTRRQ